MKNSKIVLAIAIAAGLLAAFLTRTYLTSKDSEFQKLKSEFNKKHGTIEALCFSKDMPSGTVIQKADLYERTVPAAGVRGQALTRMNIPDIVGRKLVTSRNAKEILFWSDVEGGNPLRGGIADDIRRKMRMEALVKFMTLRSLSAKGKIRQAVDFVRTFLANNTPLILFCSLHEVVDELKKAFPKAVSVTGRDSMQAKQAAVDAFQSGRAQLIICSIKAAGVGLTLTASSNVAFVEFPWTYADCCQCEDRAHRIGQKDNVTCYYLIGRHTIDHSLYQIIHRKKSIANQIMAADDDIPTDELYFDQLVEQYLTLDNDG